MNYRHRNLLSYLPLLFICWVGLFAIPSRAEISNTAADIGSIGIPLTAGLIAIAKEDEDGLVMLLEGAAYTIIATHSLKFAINAERPNGGDYSFPSGHTSSATQGAAYLQFRYAGNTECRHTSALALSVYREFKTNIITGVTSLQARL